MPESITVVGVTGDGDISSKEGQVAVERADVVVAGRRHLASVAPTARRSIVIGGDIDTVLDEIAAVPGAVCVLASGDPGFFGIVRTLAARFGRHALVVHPAPSSVALAFARIGLPWDDVAVVSCHGRSLDDAVEAVLRADKAAVLVSPDNPPEAVARAVTARGAGARTAVVCSRLGTPDEAVVETHVAGVAASTWDPLSVLIVLGHDVAGEKSLAWGLDDQSFAHRDGMITKAEVRAVALGKLELPQHGVLWDVGAGSGSVAIECARLSPGLEVHAVEVRADDVARIESNAAALGARVAVHTAAAPDVLADLPAPDRVFVGGGGIDVVHAALGRLRPHGRIVATFAAVGRAAAAAELLGSMVQVSVSRGSRLPDGAFRLDALNPVFVVWGPEA